MRQTSHILQNLNELLWTKLLDILETNNILLLDKNYTPEKKYYLKDYDVFKEFYENLKDEAYLLDKSNEAKSLIDKSMDKMYLVNRMENLEVYKDKLRFWQGKEALYMIADRMTEFNTNVQELYAMIVKEEKKIKIQYFESIQMNIDIIGRFHDALTNEYNTRHKDLVGKIEKKRKNRYSEILKVGEVIGLKLDPTTMVCAEWFAAKENAREIIKERQIENAKRKHGNKGEHN